MHHFSVQLRELWCRNTWNSRLIYGQPPICFVFVLTLTIIDKIISAAKALKEEAQMSEKQVADSINHQSGVPFLALAKKRAEAQVHQVFRILHTEIMMSREMFCSISAIYPYILVSPPDTLIDTVRALVRVFSHIDNAEHDILHAAIKSHPHILRVSDDIIQDKTYTLAHALNLNPTEVAQLLSRFAYVLRISSETICDNVKLFEQRLSTTSAREAILQRPVLLCRRTDVISRRFEVCEKLGINQDILIQVSCCPT